MAQLTINIANAAQATKVLDAICTRFGYTGFLADGVTAISKQELYGQK